MGRGIFILKFSIFCWLAMIGPSAFAQLSDFNLSVSTTDETCSGNGSISMTVSGTNPNAEIVYLLFLLPDTGTPIAQTSANVFNNLDSGNYLVVARQTLGDLQNTQSANAVINDVTTTLDFEISQATVGDCNLASLVVNVLSGNAVSYEILSGPVTAPPQESNTFNNLVEGTYVIRVYDHCNNALTKTYTLLLNPNEFELSNISLPLVYDSCETLNITNTISAINGGVLVYPISVNYTIHPPDGSGPITFSQTYGNGPEDELEITETVDAYGDQLFDVDIVAQDQCGNSVSVTSEVNPNPIVNYVTPPGYCGFDLQIKVIHFMPPYTIEFTSAPDGFNPEAFNGSYPGPFSSGTVDFSQEEEPVPYGTYSVVVTDACGRSGSRTFEIIEEPIEPVVSAANGGCDPAFGSLTASIPDRDIVSAIFTEVPSNYGTDPPVDVSEFIVEGILTIIDLTPGAYLLELIDNCGNTYLEPIDVPQYEEEPPNVLSTPNCTSQSGTLRIASAMGSLESAIITSAPETFQQTLPYDASGQILGNGVFYMNELPEGTYTVEVIDECGNEYIITQAVQAYISNPGIYNLERNCGSFNLGIFDLDESVWDQTYWFQKFFPDSNTWGHPFTGASFTEGEMPNSTNSIEIQNEETIYNIFLVGTFRLIKAFQPFNNPTPEQRCYDIFAEFEVSSDLVINGVYNLNCEGANGPSDILVDVTGVEPYNFSIVSPIVFDNGSNNIFTNLSPGTYEIKVEDVCGSIENIIVNLEDLLPVVNIFPPTDMVMCSENNNVAQFDLSQQNEQLLGEQNPENFTITYHTNLNDANSGNNPLPETYENTSNPQTIYARVIHNILDLCYQTAAFQLIVGNIPQLGSNETVVICDGDTAILSAISGYDAYLWSTTETTESIVIDAAGTYSVTVSENYSDFFCESTKTFTVIASGIATIEEIITEDWSSNNSISVIVSGLGDYEYSLDGVTYQPENSFGNLPAGEYTIYVRDINGCGVVTEDVYLLDYMKFFTPNGDTIKEYWQIVGAQHEPNMEITIFDRYGKLLTFFYGHDAGWNGKYNGQNMPTNDYWFVVKRESGQIHKGHFTLKR